MLDENKNKEFRNKLEYIICMFLEGHITWSKVLEMEDNLYIEIQTEIENKTLKKY